MALFEKSYTHLFTENYAQRYYGVILICVLNLINMIGFSILSCILGGQALASVVDGRMSWRYVYHYPTLMWY